MYLYSLCLRICIGQSILISPSSYASTAPSPGTSRRRRRSNKSTPYLTDSTTHPHTHKLTHTHTYINTSANTQIYIFFIQLHIYIYYTHQDIHKSEWQKNTVLWTSKTTICAHLHETFVRSNISLINKTQMLITLEQPHEHITSHITYLCVGTDPRKKFNKIFLFRPPSVSDPIFQSERPK